jgi:alanyl-tRNA synthetase
MLSKQIRSAFLDFFSKQDHRVLSSSPLIPHDDPSLLFTNAGMVQFKNQFIGKESIKLPRVATSQKCLRAGGKHNDLDNVGYTARHHTFFEMLGNFSFGDYFKEEAIKYAWDFLVRELQVDKSKLYVTVYDQDQESYQLWQKISGFGVNRIIKIKTDDNFWSMGATGPCGPCTEIFYDHGEKYAGGLPGTKEQDGDRYVEIWNIVFMQYEKLASGQQVNLPNQSIDTGMGLERIAAVLQGVNSNYDTDILQTIIKSSQEISQNTDNIIAHKVIADHLRAICFLLADGVMPANEGRGYVLRRIMRRAMRYTHNLNCKKNLLHSLAPILIELMADQFDELSRAREFIVNTILSEEERFGETLNSGMKFLHSEISQIGSDKILAGAKAFKLYDTYGFPLDLTADILKEKNMQVDRTGFDEAMQKQKENARKAWVGSGEKADEKVWFGIFEKFGKTEFLASYAGEISATVLAIIKDGKQVKQAEKNEEVVVVTNQTPFYAESGGQVGDQGMLNGQSKVIDTQLYIGHISGHLTKLHAGIKEGDVVKLQIDVKKRQAIMANHSATHLLHHALRDIIGKHVLQKGSLVNAEKLRFDFSHGKGLTVDEICQVEEMVNKFIYDNAEVLPEIMPMEEAKKKGAMALFGEKYADNVRVISMGHSQELCGGTHVNRTGDIGYFCITMQESIASGVRRIEAVTREKAVQFARRKVNKFEEIVNIVKSSEEQVVLNISELQENFKKLQKEKDHLTGSLLLSRVSTEKVGAAELKIGCFEEDKVDFKTIYDQLHKAGKGFVVVLLNINKQQGRTSLFIGVSNDLMGKFQANKLLAECIDVIAGKGGGNQQIAQASGSNIDVKTEVLNILKKSILKDK